MLGIRLSLLILLFTGMNVVAQNFEYPSMEIYNASYGNDITLRYDETGIQTIAPHWEASASVQDRICYAAGEAPAITTIFRMECEFEPSAVLIRGIGPDGIEFPSQTVNPTEVSTGLYQFIYPYTSATSSFPALEVNVYDDFVIGWDFSLDGGSSWNAIDSTRNHLYVTHLPPMPEVSDFAYYYSVVDIACRGAVGATTEADVISGIWDQFSSQDLKNYEGEDLTYYKVWNASCATLGIFLQEKDAHCFMFSRIFLAAIKMNGINKTNNYITVNTEWNSVCGDVIYQFLVQEWDWGVPSSSWCPEMPYENINTGSIYVPSYDAYAFESEDVSDLDGVPGQNVPNPGSIFGGHGIALINGVYYDPSYGLTYTSIDDMESTSIAGYMIVYSSGGTTYYNFSNNLDISSLVETVETY